MKNWLFESIVLAVGIAVAGLFVKVGLSEFAARSRVVTVKGLAEMEVKADKVTWPLTYNVLGNDMVSLYNEIKETNGKITAFLKSKGIKDDGGVLVYGERAILVEVQPSDIPEEIVFDAQALEVGSEVFVKDLALPEGVTAVTDADLLVLHVEQPKEEAEAAPAETEENTEVEVVAKGKAAKEE